MIQRRLWLTGAVAAVATGAGLGWSWWRERTPGDGPWSLRFATPDGGELALASLRGAPLLLNFWATWCAPCVREMPALDRFHRAWSARGGHVVGVAIDQADAVREFLQRTPVSYPIALAGFEGAELSRQLGNDRGGLPFSVLFDARGEVRRRHHGELAEDELASWATA